MVPPPFDSYPYVDSLVKVGEIAKEEGIDVYVVGGFVRDVLLQRLDVTDVDFVTLGPGSGVRLAEAIASRTDSSMAHVYANFGTAAVRMRANDGSDLILEFVGARRESYRRDSRKPVVEDGTLKEDLERRDFTINTLAVPISGGTFGEIVDQHQGLPDLANGLLRTPLPPRETFEDDPLRMIRAARFASQLGFTLVANVETAMHQSAPRIEIVSSERIAEELNKIMLSDRPSIGLKILFETGILEYFLPELSNLAGVETVAGYGHKDNFLHTLQVVDNCCDLTKDRTDDRVLWLRWAALLHDIGKPASKRFRDGIGWTFHGHEDIGSRMISHVFKRLSLPLDERMKYVEKLVALHHRPIALVDDEVTDSAIRRLLFDAGDDIEDLMTLVRADVTSKNPSRAQRYLSNFDQVESKMVEVEEKDHLRNFQPPISGEEIMSVLGVAPGVAVGMVKENIREAILDGAIPNEKAAAEALMHEIKDDCLRRANLFDEIIKGLEPRQRRATGAIKHALFFDEIPEDNADAKKAIEDLIERTLARN